MDKMTINTATLYYGDGTVELDVQGDIAAIELSYRGDASIHPRLKQGWHMVEGKNKLIIFGITNKPLNKTEKFILLNYRGYFKPTKCRITGWDLSQANSTLIPQNIHYWDLVNVKWDDLTVKYEDLKNSYSKGKPKGKKSTGRGIAGGGY